MESTRNYWIEYDAFYEDRDEVVDGNLVISGEKTFAMLHSNSYVS
jgi:hypothetical protein